MRVGLLDLVAAEDPRIGGSVNVRIYGNVVSSTVDGPGTRAVVHFAGCHIGCPGCFNAHTHPETGPLVRDISAADLAREILAVSRSVTISGGEPTEQVRPLYELVKWLRTFGCDDIVIFTGRRVEQLRKLVWWLAIEEEFLVDTVIDGPYVAKLNEDGDPSAMMRGSSNQRVIGITTRWSPDDFFQRDVEIVLDESGNAVLTGFPNQDVRDIFNMLGQRTA